MVSDGRPAPGAGCDEVPIVVTVYAVKVTHVLRPLDLHHCDIAQVTENQGGGGVTYSGSTLVTFLSGRPLDNHKIPSNPSR